MSRNFDYTSRKLVCCGRSGRGKSTLQRQLIRAWPARFKFVFDHKGEFADKLGAHPSFTVAECEAALNSTNSVCFNPSRLYSGQLDEAFNEFCLWTFAACQKRAGRKLLAFDEAGLLVPDNVQVYKRHSIRKFAETGREWEIDLCMASQSPTDVCVKLRNQLTHWCVFNLASPDSAEPLLKYGFKWDAIEKLGVGQFITFDNDSGEFEQGETVP